MLQGTFAATTGCPLDRRAALFAREEQKATAGSHGTVFVPWVREVAIPEKPTAQMRCRGYRLFATLVPN